jgi:hypothetical protein
MHQVAPKPSRSLWSVKEATLPLTLYREMIDSHSVNAHTCPHIREGALVLMQTLQACCTAHFFVGNFKCFGVRTTCRQNGVD